MLAFHPWVKKENPRLWLLFWAHIPSLWPEPAQPHLDRLGLLLCSLSLLATQLHKQTSHMRSWSWWGSFRVGFDIQLTTWKWQSFFLLLFKWPYKSVCSRDSFCFVCSLAWFLFTGLFLRIFVSFQLSTAKTVHEGPHLLFISHQCSPAFT